MQAPYVELCEVGMIYPVPMRATGFHKRGWCAGRVAFLFWDMLSWGTLICILKWRVRVPSPC